MRVLIVDDELVVRIGLKSIICWEDHGYELVGEADNGADALLAIFNTQVDIIITDVKMPRMDGITLIRELKKLEHPPKIIVLSSYDDFGLVREALKLGASDYLLKLQMEPSTLLRVLDEVRAGIMLETIPPRQDAEEIGVLHPGDDMDQQLCDYLMNDNNFIPILPISKAICVVIKEIRSNMDCDVHGDQKKLITKTFFCLIDEIMNDCFSCYKLEMKKDGWCIIASEKSGYEGEFSEQMVFKKTAYLIQISKKYMNIEFYAGISQKISDMSELKNAFETAIQIQHYAVVNYGERVLSYVNANTLCFRLNKSLSNKESALKMLCYLCVKIEEALTAENVKALNHLVNEITTAQAGIFTENVDLALCSSIEFYRAICSFIIKQQLELSEILTQSKKDMKEILEMANDHMCFSWIEKMGKDFENYFFKGEKSKYPYQIRAALEYIDKNYFKEITTKQLAQMVCLNTSYFSAIFSKHLETGCMEYIGKIRIEKAKELLNTTEYKIFEISSAIGYNNTYYFDRVFKHETGMTPVEYRNRFHKGDC